jgi:hypothetical protein
MRAGTNPLKGKCRSCREIVRFSASVGLSAGFPERANWPGQVGRTTRKATSYRQQKPDTILNGFCRASSGDVISSG